MKFLFTPANAVWVILVLATGLSYGIAEGHSGEALGVLLVSLLFSLAAFMRWLVTDVFMELRRAPIFWRSIMLAWLVVICALLALIYALTLKYSM